VPTLTKEMLLTRDRYVCAYCAQRFRFDQLDMEHIVPSSKGGEDSWMNLVAACKACNNRKILADQMEFLLQGVPKNSRMHLSA
jgi:5-methylcytosine-specific restriction endonuclease McrA